MISLKSITLSLAISAFPILSGCHSLPDSEAQLSARVEKLSAQNEIEKLITVSYPNAAYPLNRNKLANLFSEDGSLRLFQNGLLVSEQIGRDAIRNTPSDFWERIQTRDEKSKYMVSNIKVSVEGDAAHAFAYWILVPDTLIAVPGFGDRKMEIYESGYFKDAFIRIGNEWVFSGHEIHVGGLPRAAQ